MPAAELVEFYLERNIKLIILDPFISFQNAPENANEHMEQVIAIYDGWLSRSALP